MKLHVLAIYVKVLRDSLQAFLTGPRVNNCLALSSATEQMTSLLCVLRTCGPLCVSANDASMHCWWDLKTDTDSSSSPLSGTSVQPSHRSAHTLSIGTTIIPTCIFSQTGNRMLCRSSLKLAVMDCVVFGFRWQVYMQGIYSGLAKNRVYRPNNSMNYIIMVYKL